MADFPLSAQIVKETIESLQETTVRLISELVRFPSYTGSKAEKDAQIYVEKLLSDHGFKTVRLLVDSVKSHPNFSPVNWEYGSERFNVIGTWEPTGDVQGKSLAINGHIDVVPVEQETENQWTNPPFDPVVRDGRLYGRGSGDMKAGFVAGFIAFLALQKLGYEPASRLEFHSVLEEECSGNGALALVLSGEGNHCADAVLIPEPLPGVLTAQLGVMWCSVNVSGKPVHVLNTGAGVNAIENCFQIWNDLKELEIEWNSTEYRKNIPGAKLYDHMVHPINFNLGKINGGAWASSVPSSCTFQFRIGFFPGQELTEIREKIENRIKIFSQSKNILFSIEWCGFQAEGVYFDNFENSEIGKILFDSHKIITNENLEFNVATCTTDVRHYVKHSPKENQRNGVTCYGPEAKNIHGIDESVSLASVNQVAAVFALFIENHCKLNKIKN